MAHPRLLVTSAPVVLGSAAFAPTDIAGLGLWLQADKASALWQDAMRTIPAVADADPVGSWDDISANAHHAQQATNTKRPLLKLNIQNGKPVVRFDLNDDFLRSASQFITGATGSVFIVHQTAGDCVLLGGNATNNRQVRIGSPSANQLYLYADGIHTRESNTLSVARTSWTMVEYIWDGSDAYFYQNGADFTPATKTFTGTMDALTDIGDTAGVNLMSGDIGEIIVYGSALSAANRVKVEAYLNARWGLY